MMKGAAKQRSSIQDRSDQNVSEEKLDLLDDLTSIELYNSMNVLLLDTYLQLKVARTGMVQGSGVQLSLSEDVQVD